MNKKVVRKTTIEDYENGQLVKRTIEETIEDMKEERVATSTTPIFPQHPWTHSGKEEITLLTDLKL